MPDNEQRRPEGNRAASTAADAHHYIAGLRRRRAAARRLPPLACGCHEPWTCRHHDGPITDRQTEAAIAAADHLIEHQLCPIFGVDQARALWRAGRRDLAVRCGTQEVVA